MEDYRIRRATRVTDADIAWIQGKLVLSLQGEELDAVTLTPEEIAKGTRISKEKNKPLEHVLRKLRLQKGGQTKFQVLREQRRIPPKPTTEVELQQQQQGSSGSLFGSLYGAAKQKFFGYQESTIAEWINEAINLYGLSRPQNQEAAITSLYYELASDVVLHNGPLTAAEQEERRKWWDKTRLLLQANPQLRNQSIVVGTKKVILRPCELRQVILTPAEEDYPLRQKIKVISQKAFNVKTSLLIHLGLLSELDLCSGIIPQEAFLEELATNLDISQLSDVVPENQHTEDTIQTPASNNSSFGDDGNQETEESDNDESEAGDTNETPGENPNKSAEEEEPSFTPEGSVYKLSISPAYYQGPTFIKGSHWDKFVQHAVAKNPEEDPKDILKDYLLQFIEDQKLYLTKEDILQQLAREPGIRPGTVISSDKWKSIIVQASGRKLKLAVEVTAITNSSQRFEVNVATNFLLKVENEYYQNLQEEQTEEEEVKIIMATPSPVAVGNVDLAVEELQHVKVKLLEHATTPWDIDDVTHYLGTLDEIEATMSRDMDAILGTPHLPAQTLASYQDQKKTVLQDRKELMLKIIKIRSKLTPPATPVRQNRQPSGSPALNIQVPKTQIPTFTGEWRDWLTYRDVMNSLVINNPSANFPDIQKFLYLQQSLQGTPRDLIKNIPVTDANFKRAWQILKDQYDDPNKMAARYHNDIARVTKLEIASAVELRKLYATLSNAREALIMLKVTGGDAYIISRLVECMDQDTRGHYEMRSRPFGVDDSDPASWDEVTSFINKRCLALENTQASARSERTHTSRRSTAMAAQWKDTDKARPQASPRAWSCAMCSGPHGLWACEKFKEKSLGQRTDFVKSKKLCFNCFSSRHGQKDCKSKFRCKDCHKKHHTLLHPAERSQHSTQQPKETRAHTATKASSHVILPTARVWVTDSSNGLIAFRALLDTGAQSSFISEKAVQSLRLRRRYANVQITGIGSTNAAHCKGSVTLQITSMVDDTVTMEIQAFILPQVTGDTPNSRLPIQDWPHLRDVTLADPDFGKPGRIDLLLGADVFFEVLTGRRMIGQPHEPVAHSTTLGWILGGSGGSLNLPNRVSAHVAVHHAVPLHVLQQFWGGQGLSEEQIKEHQDKDEQICENIFTSTTTRLEDGKLQVSIPFKVNPPALGSSREIGLKRLAGTEARLARNPDLRRQYEEFMEDYEKSGHMEEVQSLPEHAVYLPHHPVVRTTALTTKLRVVFDASAKTSNGRSVNDNQLIGSQIQDDLFSILTRFRLHQVAINGDIAKMYRQIWVEPSHQDYQCILWRRKPEDPISQFKLKTVTYGTASAPWLATRSLKWIAEKEREHHPEAARIIANDHYMDDCLSGADSPEDAHRIQQEVTSILLSYGLPLRKWASNDEWVIRTISGDQEMLTNPEEVIKTLGLKWNAKMDCFQFKVKLKELNKITKREMISEIACTFDPLGFAAPVLVKAKILYQEVWATPTGWDDLLPEPIAKNYQALRQQLSELESISLPRWVGTLSTDEIELHGFSDASEKAYGAAVYLRVINSSGTASNLVASKTRVAPTSTVSLPRLELMGAVLLAELMQKIITAYRRPVQSLYYWTDSTITLAWIQSQPGRFKTFVANRIAAIQELSKKEEWKHVGTKDNPADFASRGILPQELTGAVKQMWFHGPYWLREGTLPATTTLPEAEEELKKIKVLHATAVEDSIMELIERTSSFNHLWKVVAWMCRFAYNTRHKERYLEPQLKPSEREGAIRKIIAIVQKNTWSREIQGLDSVRATGSREELLQVMKKSNVSNLNPILDKDGILRVGGRLEHSNKEFTAKHPAILPYGHLAKIYMQELHVKTLHAGPTLLLATARQEFWIIRGPQLAKEVVKKCVACNRWKQETMSQQMGNLPSARTEGLRAFNVVGVDYAGPMVLKNHKGRGAKTSKAWICVFVCFSTKAIHLELVSELTTEAFIATLRRFIARRGLPREMHSDNGTNFVGAQKELKELLQQEQFQQGITGTALGEGIEWKFIPPSAPHQGGLWESAVKSVKHHLRRVMGAAMLTFEEFTTVLCQIEAQLNSRPLCPLTEDSSDLNFLTPGHFLIGQPMTTAPDPSLASIKENRLSRWQYLQRLEQEFWAKWHLEYLASMQKRYKWKYPQEDIKLDALVLIKEDNIAPTHWRRGRVIALHPGQDGKTRVVKLRTSQGEVMRPIVKLIPLV